MTSSLNAHGYRRPVAEQDISSNADVNHFRESEHIRKASSAQDQVAFYWTMILGMGVICAGSAVIIAMLI